MGCPDVVLLVPLIHQRALSGKIPPFGQALSRGHNCFADLWVGRDVGEGNAAVLEPEQWVS